MKVGASRRQKEQTVTAKRQGRYVLCGVSTGVTGFGTGVEVWRRQDVGRGMDGITYSCWFLLLFLQADAHSTTSHLTGSALPPPGALTLFLTTSPSSGRGRSGLSASTCKLLTACLCWSSLLCPAEVLWMVLQRSDEIFFLETRFS